MTVKNELDKKAHEFGTMMMEEVMTKALNQNQ
jgi:hypothetical protein